MRISWQTLVTFLPSECTAWEASSNSLPAARKRFWNRNSTKIDSFKKNPTVTKELTDAITAFKPIVNTFNASLSPLFARFQGSDPLSSSIFNMTTKIAALEHDIALKYREGEENAAQIAKHDEEVSELKFKILEDAATKDANIAQLSKDLLAANRGHKDPRNRDPRDKNAPQDPTNDAQAPKRDERRNKRNTYDDRDRNDDRDQNRTPWGKPNNRRHNNRGPQSDWHYAKSQKHNDRNSQNTGQSLGSDPPGLGNPKPNKPSNNWSTTSYSAEKSNTGYDISDLESDIEKRTNLSTPENKYSRKQLQKIDLDDRKACIKHN